MAMSPKAIQTKFPILFSPSALKFRLSIIFQFKGHQEVGAVEWQVF